MEKRERKIKVIEKGPYLVSGNVPLREKIIVPVGEHYEYQDGQQYPQKETYALCRCGKTKNAPFCDGSHQKGQSSRTRGKETASRDNYLDRAVKLEGSGLDLLDDDRCAFARFCHREEGNVWEMIKKADNPEFREAAIKAASDCPTGRLVAVEKDGKLIEPELEPAIEILQDPQQKVSGPLFVKGMIPIESGDGYTYEVRNRAALCRCGWSTMKPFCDAMHVSFKYKDKLDDDPEEKPLKKKLKRFLGF